MQAKKSLGQHFLHCNWVVSTLVQVAELDQEDTVLEIGPGTGVLTRALAKKAKQVVAVEKDERLVRLLEQSLAKEKIANVKIIRGDILKLWKFHFHSGAEKMVANIPYYLTGRLLHMILEDEKRPCLIVLTIQKEVAQRIIAKPPHMNLLALSVQAFGTPKIIKTVPANCFSPRPKVDSAIIKISDISDRFFKTNQLNPTDFFEIVRTAFSQKRKLLLNSLGSRYGKTSIGHALEAAGLSPRARPEELTLTQWADLTNKTMEVELP